MSTQQVDTGTDQVLCEITEAVAVITLNRPEARNALSDELTPALRRMIKEMDERPDVKVLLITGAGTAFCAGGDVKGMSKGIGGREMSTDERIEDLKIRQRTLTGALRAVRKPTIAALPGPAAGAGLSIALACDIRLASSSAFISTGYARVGLSGDYGIAWMLTNLVGTAIARELMYTARRVEADECLSLGLVNTIFPDEIFREKAFDLARQIASGLIVTLGLMKDNLDDALEIDFDIALDREAERLVKSAQTHDHKEAVKAFIEKRDPEFTGS